MLLNPEASIWIVPQLIVSNIKILLDFPTSLFQQSFLARFVILSNNFFINRILRHGFYRILLTALIKSCLSRKRIEEIHFEKKI
jgi:hypothetical protein